MRLLDIYELKWDEALAKVQLKCLVVKTAMFQFRDCLVVHYCAKYISITKISQFGCFFKRLNIVTKSI